MPQQPSLPARRRSLRQVNREPTGAAMRRTVMFLNALMRPFTRSDWNGTEHLPAGGCVVAVNHISNVDPLAVGQFLAYSGRWPRFLGKASLFRIPVVGAIITACGQIPVERDSRNASLALAAATAAVREGKAVVVYPEGTITLDPDLWPMTGRVGAARIALETGCPVIPVGQWGAQEIMYGKRIHLPHLLPPKTLRLTAGPPVPLDDLAALPLTPQVLGQATDRIMDAVTALVAGLRNAEPPPVRFDSRSARRLPSAPAEGGAGS